MTPDADPLARLLAGGRHVRLLIAGHPPPALMLPDLRHFERVARLARPGQPGDGGAVADPTRLPFVEALFDRALVTTPLPALTARAELREIWRVLSPAGLALFIVKARRPWQLGAPGWRRGALEPQLADAMFEVLAWTIAALPDRHHQILVGKRDGLQPTMIGRVDAMVPAAAPSH